MNGVQKKRLLNSLNRVAGHSKGIRNMIRGERCIADVMLQLSAVRAGVVKTQVLALKGCLHDEERSLDELKALCRLVMVPLSGAGK